MADNIKMDLKGWSVVLVFMWLRIGIGGGGIMKFQVAQAGDFLTS
jgi:hypothetical protein